MTDPFVGSDLLPVIPHLNSGDAVKPVKSRRARRRIMQRHSNTEEITECARAHRRQSA